MENQIESLPALIMIHDTILWAILVVFLGSILVYRIIRYMLIRRKRRNRNGVTGRRRCL